MGISHQPNSKPNPYQFLLTWLLILLAALHSLLTQTHYFLNADVAFLTQMALYGQSGDLYTQYYEINPPLIVYIYRLFLAPYYWGELSIVSALRFSMVTYLLLITLMCQYYLYKLKLRHATLWVIAIALAFLFVLPAAFLQREHIISAAMIGYFCMLTCRVNHIKTAMSMRVASITLAAFAVCLKPQYIIVLALLEGWLLWRHREIKSLFRAENIIIAIIGISYVGFVYLYHPHYFSLVAPLASETYIAYFEGAESMLIRLGLLLLLLFLPYRYLTQQVTEVHLVQGLYLVAIAALSAFLVGRAGFSYHLLLTFTTLSIVLLAAWFYSLQELIREPKARQVTHCVFFFMMLLFVRHFHFIDIDKINYQDASKTFLSTSNHLPEKLIEYQDYKVIYDALKPHVTSGQNVYMFGARLFPAHPIAMHLGLKWIGHFPVLWALPQTLKATEGKKKNTRLAWISQVVTEDIKLHKPSAILVEENEPLLRYPLEFGFVEHFTQYQVFQNEFEHYQKLGSYPSPDGNWVIYLRQEE
ncbi:hypothetical protein VISI1226_19911 [Vibrio sinaloensis DSM 21326]|uniref:Glycosyltransferase RgtA/B/C/D-like domain-containing protein n=1 Tax=Vibrio sinaloensis DSM 21326 TaxID=945550 RepID=E8M9T6_PHOS4|nr:hypothetical protein [Vibrio sinaloensis]EGA69230.1 hypothetical protein VISI1226_19911 [Vibrio sinaloensis DSM 21326]